MSFGSESESSALANLSAMADGELGAAAAAQACAAWRDDGSVRAAWHAYHVIGDVLRSEDLAAASLQDAAFLASLRTRLAAEPTVLAPDTASQPGAATRPLPARAAGHGSHGARRSWMAPSAVAAGFVLVAGAVMVTRVPEPELAAPQVVAVSPPAQLATAPSVPASQVAVEPQALVVDGKLVRDARLDRYLAAHKQFAGSSVLGVPSGFLRNAATEAPNR